MFSGNDSSGEAGNLNQLGLFMASGAGKNIDWAQLAQQWIMMRDNTETAPPEPNLSGYKPMKMPLVANQTRFEEQGEAEMEMDDDIPPPAPPISNVAVPDSLQWLLQQQEQQQGGSIDPHQEASAAWNMWPNNATTTANVQKVQVSKSNPTAHIPSLMKINVTNPNEQNLPEGTDISGSATATMDAAKRKILPAWIREGLEKMEREKQKQLEREQQLKDHDDDHSTNLDSPLRSAEEITVKNHVLKAVESGDSTGNEDEATNDGLDSRPNSVIQLKSKRNDDNDLTGNNQSNSHTSNEDEDIVGTTTNVGKSYEQKLADLMFSVRRTLTELLLEVTNEEIARISQETLNSNKLKASSAQVIRKSALSSITNKLGLAAYSSSGESESDDSAADSDDDTRNERRRSGNNTITAAEDSEDEIRSKLRLRRRAFAKISEEIEERVAANAAREDQKIMYYKQKEQQQQRNNHAGTDNGRHNAAKKYSNTMSSITSAMSTAGGSGKSSVRDFGETTTESKLQHSNGKRLKERSSRRGERTTRFSDNKDSKSITAATTASFITQQLTTAAPSASQQQTQNFPMTAAMTTANLVDPSKISNLYAPSTAAAAAGITSMLNAAEAALEKAAKGSSSSRSSAHRKHDSDSRNRRRRRRHSSDDSDSSSSQSASSTSNSTNSSESTVSSRNSKHSRTSKKRKRSRSRSRHRHDDRKRREHRDHHRNRHGDSHHDDRYYSSHRTASSPSKSSSKHHYHHSSSSSRHSTRRRSTSSRDRSRSRSTYSSTSTRHRH